MKLRDSLAENKSIRLQAEAETWQDAVKIGVDLLVAADVVEPRYYQAILDAVEQHGPYFVLAPGLAMPHGRPEEGVKKTGFALVTLKKPLEFNHEDNDPVDILITMAAVDANTHQEVGTILCVGEGVRAVRDLKALYPHKIVLADAKIADAGKILSRMCFEANADWVTVICCADINTAKGALDVAKEFNGDVQIELTGYWTWEQAQQWRDAGIGQVVYHRSRDAQAAGVAWGEADITAIKRLSDMGFKVTVTGGLALEDLPLFKGIPIHVFIAGRSIRDAASPVEAARQFKRSIAELWG
ncbi:TPA: PTS ascorbate transporter subunit IIA [Escherichia coli]|nr:PTS ascorbate transporter subunit IIA [Escherichia coli]